MITNEEYSKLKKYLKTLSKPEIRQLADDMELKESEKDVLLSIYNGDTVVKICMDNYISDFKFHTDKKLLYSRINNYLKFKGISIR